MRIIDILDGFSSASVPTILATLANKLVNYATDGAYETANGSPSGGEVYYNTTSNKIRYFDAGSSTWKNIGDAVGYQEIPAGLINGSNTQFNVSFLPNNTESLLVFIDGTLLKDDEYSFSNPTITLDVAPQVGQELYVFYITTGDVSSPPVAVGNNNVLYVEFDAGDISNKFITLPSSPSISTQVMVDIIGGTTQHYGVDYSVTGNQLSWNSLGMDGLIASGDVIRVQYFN